MNIHKPLLLLLLAGPCFASTDEEASKVIIPPDLILCAQQCWSGGFYQMMELAGSPVNQRANLNFIQGANVTLTVADNPGNNSTDVTIASSGCGLGTSTVAGLPAASANTNKAYIVTDGASANDCTTGSASTRVICVSNGSAWIATLPTALPNGTTATTQSPGDNTTKVATDAFVLANGSGLPPNPPVDAVVSMPCETGNGTTPGTNTWCGSGQARNRPFSGVTDTILASDLGGVVTFTGSSATIETVPAPPFVTTPNITQPILLLWNDGSANITANPTACAAGPGGGTCQAIVDNAAASSSLMITPKQHTKWTFDVANTVWRVENLTTSAGGATGAIVQVPTTSQTIAPAANNIVGLTVKGTTGTGTPHIQDWNTSGGGAGSAASIDATGNLNAVGTISASNNLSANGNIASNSSAANLYCSATTGTCSYGSGNQSSGDITAIQFFGIGSNSSTGGNKAAGTILSAGDELGATGANSVYPTVCRGGIATSATSTSLGFCNEADNYFKGAGTTTLWNLQCMTTTAYTVNDCPTTAISAEGVANSTNASLLVIRAGRAPVNSDNAVTIGHTVCTSTTVAGQIHDSGGTTSCTVGQNVGRVVATSGTVPIMGAAGVTWQNVTLSTTLPLISLRID